MIFSCTSFVGRAHQLLVMLAFALGSMGAAAAVEPIRVESCQRIDLDGRHVEIATDPQGRATVFEAQSLHFEPAPRHHINQGVSGGALWLRLSVQGAGCEQPLFFELGNPFANRVMVYREVNAGEWVADWAAQVVHGPSSLSRLRHAALAIHTDALSPVRYMVEIRGPSSLMAAPSIVAGMELSGLSANRMLLGAIFTGGILSLAIYCVCLAWTTRLRGLLAYAVSALAFAVFYGSANGLLDTPILWSLSSGQDPFETVVRLNTFAAVTVVVFHWFFVQGLLSDGEPDPWRRPGILAMLAGWSAMVLAIPLMPVGQLPALSALAFGGGTLAIAARLRKALRKGRPLARVMSAACLLVGVGSAAFLAAYFGVQGWHPAWIHTMALGASAEAILLSVVVGGHVKTLQSQQQALTARTRELSVLSRLDALTGLGNRRAYDSAVPAEIERCLRRGRVASLLVVDIDHFKSVNDAFGHAFGDSVIRALGVTLANCVRSTDFAFRYGGEEFVLLLPGLDLAMAREIALRVMDDFAQAAPRPLDKPTDRFTVSIGMSQLRPDDFAAGLFARADAAMYRAKRNGRNRMEAEDGAQSSSADANSAALNAWRSSMDSPTPMK